MPKLALSPVNEPNSPILIVSWENAEPATARMTPKTRRNRRFIMSAGLLAIGEKTARAFAGCVQRLAFTVRRSTFNVQRSTFNVQGSTAERCNQDIGNTVTVLVHVLTLSFANCIGQRISAQPYP